jgi:hypothetical protein
MLVVVEDGGGLANRLFVFANAIATGLETGHRVANPPFRRWAEHFEGTYGDHLAIHPKRARPWFGERLSAKIAASLSYRSREIFAGATGFGPIRTLALEWPDFLNLDDPRVAADLSRRRLVFLKGWLFRNRSGVERHAAAIRDFLRPVERIRREANRVVEKARDQKECLVGVHIRHGDYRDFLDGRYFYDLPIYLASMRSVADMLAPRSTAFLVCSDERQDLEGVDDLTVTASAMGLVHDLWALSRCDMVMGPPSTFSTWASFLGEVPRWEMTDPGHLDGQQDFVVPLPVPRTPEEMGINSAT